MTPRDTPQDHVGDIVVVPACDVGVVEAVVCLEVDGQSDDFFRIRFERGGTSWVPVDRLLENGVRKVMGPDKADEMLKLVGEQEVPENRGTWNRRQRRYREIMLENRPQGMAELIGELAAVRRDKGSLSFGEKKLFDQVKTLLVSELAVSLELGPELAAARLEDALNVPQQSAA